MTSYCAVCEVYWRPYQAKAATGTPRATSGCCPECGGVTVRSSEAGSLDADARFKAAQARKVERERSEKRHEEFETFYARRERAALESMFAEVEALPVAESRRRGA